MKDERYQALKTMIEAGKIKRLEQFFPIVPKTNIALALKMRPAKLNDLKEDIGRFSIADMHALANLVEVDYAIIHNLLNDQYQEEKARNKRKK